MLLEPSILLATIKQPVTIYLYKKLLVEETMKKQLMFISKSGYVDSVKRRAEEEGALLLTIQDLFI